MFSSYKNPISVLAKARIVVRRRACGRCGKRPGRLGRGQAFSKSCGRGGKNPGGCFARVFSVPSTGRHLPSGQGGWVCFGSMDLDLQRLRGLCMVVMRRIRGLNQSDVAPLLSIGNKEVSAVERGIGADDRALSAYASVLEFEPYKYTRLLECLRSLDAPTERRSTHPYDPTAAESVAVGERVLKVAWHSHDWLVDRLRRDKHEQAKALAPEQLRRLFANQALRDDDLIGAIRGRRRPPPHDLRLAIVHMAPEFHNWALGELLVKESRRAAARDANEAFELSELAIAVAHLVGRCRLLAHGIGVRGNALRVAGDLERSDADLRRALLLWETADDDGGLLDGGLLWSFLSSLRRGQRRFAEALDALDRGMPYSQEPGRLLFKRAVLFEHCGELDSALETLSQAERELLGDGAELRDRWMVYVERGNCLCHLGRFDEAAPFARDASAIAEQLGNRLDELRSIWLQARVSGGLGDGGHAISCFTLLREEFGASKLDYDLALVTLELSALLLELGHFGEAQALALDLPKVFASKSIGREALAALMIVCEALRNRAASADLIRRTVAELYRLRGLR